MQTAVLVLHGVSTLDAIGNDGVKESFEYWTKSKGRQADRLRDDDNGVTGYVS